MKHCLNFIAGVTGTIGAMTLPEMAATAAGFGTAAWMITQIILSIRRDRREATAKNPPTT